MDNQDLRDRVIADAIKSGKCPFDMLQDGKPMSTCPLGFPGCGCADELMINPYLQDMVEGLEDPEVQDNQDNQDNQDSL